MKTIKIKFVDFYPVWDDNNNFIIRALRKIYNVELSDKPDYLFFSCFGNENLKYNNCIKIFYSGEDVSPDFNLCDYAMAFDNIEYGDRYIRLTNFAARGVVDSANRKHIFSNEELLSKKKFCNFVVSNGTANPIRKEFFEKLSSYKTVDSGGRYLNNIGGPVKDKIEFQKDYKFSICFENDFSAGYTTEKIIDAFIAKTIPIYWGNKNIDNDFNTKSFINCHDYDSLDDVIDYIIKVDNSPELFEQILSEPVFDGGKVPYKFSEQYLIDFLRSIIDRPIDEARRLSSYSRRNDYRNDRIKWVRNEEMISRSIILRIIRKIYNKICPMRFL